MDFDIRYYLFELLKVRNRKQGEREGESSRRSKQTDSGVYDWLRNGWVDGWIDTLTVCFFTGSRLLS